MGNTLTVAGSGKHWTWYEERADAMKVLDVGNFIAMNNEHFGQTHERSWDDFPWQYTKEPVRVFFCPVSKSIYMTFCTKTPKGLYFHKVMSTTIESLIDKCHRIVNSGASCTVESLFEQAQLALKAPVPLDFRKTCPCCKGRNP